MAAAAPSLGSDELIDIACIETGLARVKLTGEIGRTALQFRFFGDVLREGRYLEAAIDPAALARWPGFTGSLRGGRALLEVVNDRDEPIPFYGEMSSLNPVIVTPAAAAERV